MRKRDANKKEILSLKNQKIIAGGNISYDLTSI